MVDDYINKNLRGEKYMFSASREYFLGMKLEKFSYDIIYSLYPFHINIPFILFDETYEFCANFHFDLYITGFSREDGNRCLDTSGGILAITRQ